MTGLKTKTIAINPVLHRFLKLISTLDAVGMNELAEAPLWEIVRENKERLEQVTGQPVEIPDPKQLALIPEAVS